MITRRTFIKNMSLASGALVLNPFNHRLFGNTAGQFFALHPFIENNPDAVFIMRTNVDSKLNSDALKQAGLDFGRSVFMNTDDEATGTPLDNAFAIKPNLTSRGTWERGYTVEGTMGVITDAHFVEGTIESMKEIGISSDNIAIREVNGTENLTDGGYGDMADRTGADVQIIPTPIGTISENKIQWVDVPDGVWFNRIPFLDPVHRPGSWLLNISKFKTHSMGLTLCAKNIQGTIAAKYQQHCTDYNSKMSINADHINSDAFVKIKANYDRHVADGVPRWDVPGWSVAGGLGMETWASRCLDNNSVTKPGLHVIEGVYGRDGDFVVGPHDGLAMDYMTNVIIFGKNAFNVDNVGHWLAGHEPGNFGLFHLALERGLTSVLNPLDIPIYEWKNDSTATLTPLDSFERTLLVTNYLQKDGEEFWHMCDEPFLYPTSIEAEKIQKPSSYVLMQNYPNPFNPSTTIQFNLSENGNVKLDIFNSQGTVVDVLAEGHFSRGSHMVVWNSKNLPSGTYFYRLRAGAFNQTRKMLLLK
ncbi:MAG: DUF362 domain-containing protein [Calditrichae bacterium]|nr:DUF362 domain-containing protein [Calditrichia bacterium]